MADTLRSVSNLYIKQKIDWLEVFSDFKEANRYGIFMGKDDAEAGRNKWMNAYEESECCNRQCFRPNHEYKMHVRGQDGRPVLRGEHPCGCFTHSMTVFDAASEKPLASFEQSCMDYGHFCGARTRVKDALGNHMYDFVGPSPCYIGMCGQCPCRDEMVWQAESIDGKDRAFQHVSNVPNGCCKMCFTTADDYNVSFGQAQSTEDKAVIFMFAFFLDYMYFQARKDRKDTSAANI